MHDLFTPEFFNILIIGNLVLGLILVAIRFRIDMKRPIRRSRRLLASRPAINPNDDTQPIQPYEER